MLISFQLSDQLWIIQKILKLYTNDVKIDRPQHRVQSDRIIQIIYMKYTDPK